MKTQTYNKLFMNSTYIPQIGITTKDLKFTLVISTNVEDVTA